MTSPRPRGNEVVEQEPEFWFSCSFLECFLLAFLEARVLNNGSARATDECTVRHRTCTGGEHLVGGVAPLEGLWEIFESGGLRDP